MKTNTLYNGHNKQDIKILKDIHNLRTIKGLELEFSKNRYETWDARFNKENGTPFVYIELKTRKFRANKYKTDLIESSKIKKLIKLSRNGKKSLVVNAFSDGYIYVYVVGKDGIKTPCVNKINTVLCNKTTDIANKESIKIDKEVVELPKSLADIVFKYEGDSLVRTKNPFKTEED